MYFLSDVEHKYLINQLLPTAREVGVSKELRGWSWYQPPLKPYYDNVRLPMYAVGSKYCPSDRAVYLHNVEKIRPKPPTEVALGKMFHGVVSDCLSAFLQNSPISFEEWWSKIRWDEIHAKPESVRGPSQKVWDFVSKLCEAKILRKSFSSRYLDLPHPVSPLSQKQKIYRSLSPA